MERCRRNLCLGRNYREKSKGIKALERIVYFRKTARNAVGKRIEHTEGVYGEGEREECNQNRKNKNSDCGKSQRNPLTKAMPD